MNNIAQTITVFGFAILVAFLIGLWINTFASGYVSLEHKNKSTARRIWESLIGLLKIFLP